MERVPHLLLVLGAMAYFTGTARGYVPTRAEGSGVPLRWTGTNCVVVRPYIAGAAEINDGSEFSALLRAISNWHRATAHCTYLRFRAAEPTTNAVPAFTRGGYNENAVFFVERGWSHDASATALTTVKYVSHPGHAVDGKILDADIELNAEGFALSTAGDEGAADLEAVLTHELGHVIGLDHPCDDGSPTSGPRFDDAGQPLPSCSAAPPSMRETTMFNYADPGEQEKRTPEEDDIRGFCSTYPLPLSPGRCAALENQLTGGCALAGHAALGPSLALLLLALSRWGRGSVARRD